MMRQARGSQRSTFVGLLLGVAFVYFLYSIHNSSVDQSELRLRVQTSAAENPLSPPTSAFRKQSKSQNGRGVRRPPPVVHYQLNNLSSTAFPAVHNEKVLILTPLARFYPEYWSNLLSLSYPHEHISLGFITPKTKEGNAATIALQEAIKDTQSGPVEQRFQSVTILRQDFEPPLNSQDEKERHKMENQKSRRASMAKARNSLLFTTIGPSTSWVLWLDGDVVESPPTLIQDLASHDKPVIAPSCMQRFTNDEGQEDIRPYDYNTWRDSDVAQELASKMDADEVLLEGYAEMATYRTLMTKLANTGKNRDERRLMPLDGVGGTALLVKAEVHRDGAMFPPFPFYHLIETEGFAKMAQRLGFDVWGLPDYFVSASDPLRRRKMLRTDQAQVYHYNE
jgi:mannan polymerase complexes MNN9 subunit